MKERRTSKRQPALNTLGLAFGVLTSMLVINPALPFSTISSQQSPNWYFCVYVCPQDAQDFVKGERRAFHEYTVPRSQRTEDGCFEGVQPLHALRRLLLASQKLTRKR